MSFNRRDGFVLLCHTHFEGLVVVAVHVAHKEVQDGHVHNIQQAAALIVGVHLLHQLTVLVI